MLKYLVTLSLFASVGLYDVSEAVPPALIVGGGLAAGGGLTVAGIGLFSLGAMTGAGVTAGTVGTGMLVYCKIKEERDDVGCPKLKKKIQRVPKFIGCLSKKAAKALGIVFNPFKWGKRRRRKKNKCFGNNQKEIDRIENENKEAIEEQIRYLKEFKKWCRRNPRECNGASLSMSFSASTSGSSSSSSSSSSESSSRGGKGRYSSSRGGAGGSSSSSEGLVVGGGGGGGVDMSESSEDGMVGGGGYPAQRGANGGGAQRGESVGIFGFDQYTEIGFILMAMFSLVVMIFCIKQSCFQQSIPMVYTASGCNQKTLDMEY